MQFLNDYRNSSGDLEVGAETMLLTAKAKEKIKGHLALAPRPFPLKC